MALRILEKIKFMVWLAIHGALPVNAHKFPCSLAPSVACSKCSSPLEDVLHTLHDFPHSREVWYRFGCGFIAGFSMMDVWTWIASLTQHDDCSTLMHILWWVWRWRCHTVMSTEPWDIETVVRKVQTDLIESTFLLTEDNSGLQQASKWVAPDRGWVKLNVDGSCHEHASDIACGGVIRNHHGKCLNGFSSFEGQGDAHMAELLAVVRGLTLAEKDGHRKVICESNCLNVVESLVGKKTENLHSCPAILTEIRCLLLHDWEVQFQHVAREYNSIADLLAKRGLKEKWCLTTWKAPPTDILQLKEFD